MDSGGSQNFESKQLCNIPLCGKDADWEVDLFGKVEYYCMRHKPGVPERFMLRLSLKHTTPQLPPGEGSASDASG